MSRVVGSVFGPLHKKGGRISSRIWRFALLIAVGGLSFGSVMSFVVPSVHAAAALPFQAEVSGAQTTLQAGTDKQITLKFKNIGTETWIASSKQVAVYVYGDSSIFGHPSWLKDDLPAIISPSRVLPGQMASASFLVHAPSVSGTYTERFLLSSDTKTWIKGSVVTVTFTVVGGSMSAISPSNVTPSSGPTILLPPSAAVTVADSSAWKAVLIDKGGIEWQLELGGHTIVTLAFQNKGTQTWVKEGTFPIWLITQNARKSLFKDFSWKTESQTAILTEAKVPPGGTGHFTLELRAPMSPGSYQEAFQLAVGGTQMMSGSTVTLPIHVATPGGYITQGVTSGVAVSSVTPTPSSGTTNGLYQTMLLLKSASTVMLSGNGRLALTYGFKNTGRADWSRLSLRIAGVMPALSGKLSSVQDESWYSSIEPVVTTKQTKAGEIGFIGFTIKAPAKMGKYVASFHLYADNQQVDDGQLDIPITVTADGYIAPDALPNRPSTPAITPTPTIGVPPLTGDVSSLPDEPIIRVGLFATTDDQMIVRAVSGGFSLQQNGTKICQFTSGESVTVHFDRANKVYKATGPRCTSQSSDVYATVADDGLSPLELTDFTRLVSWLPSANDNKFRAKLELHYAKSSDSVWIINELPIEWYLKGIGETSNSSPAEYQKALLTAARTYAMYHVQHGTKHAAENYIVDATYDQVYRGYGAEARDPAVVSAVDATRGQIVTYQGKLAITPYYSRSDGRTRSWSEVWGGSVPWCVSVAVPWDQGRVLWGHGVGMSATGALGMAADGKKYDEILHLFYTGIDLRQIYK